MLKRLFAAGALGFAALAYAAPATAQDFCEPGVFGEGGGYAVRDGDNQRVTSALVEFQCGDQLSDGTYIPTGYRVALQGDCDGVACNYPVVVATPMAQENLYGARFVMDGKNVAVRLRPLRRQEGVNIVLNARVPERGAQAEVSRYRLTPRQTGASE